MRHKKLLLVAFFAALFVFQQVQASAKMPSVAQVLSPAGVLQSYNAPSTIYVRMYHLYQATGFQVQPPYECGSGDNAYGCTQLEGSTYYYPYDTNPALVDVENDYLLDVVAHEMPPQLYPNPAALSAQAIAARSFAYYWPSLTPPWNLANRADVWKEERFG